LLQQSFPTKHWSYALSRSCSGRTTRPPSPSKQAKFIFVPRRKGQSVAWFPYIKSPLLVTKPPITGSIKRTKSCHLVTPWTG